MMKVSEDCVVLYCSQMLLESHVCFVEDAVVCFSIFHKLVFVGFELVQLSL